MILEEVPLCNIIENEAFWSSMEVGIELKRVDILKREEDISSVEIKTNQGKLKVTCLDHKKEYEVFFHVREGENNYELAKRMGKNIDERKKHYTLKNLYISI